MTIMQKEGGGFSPYRIDILNKSLSPYLTFSSEFEFLRDISPIDDPPSAKKVDFISAKISNIVNMGHGSFGSPLVFVCPEGRGPEGGWGQRLGDMSSMTPSLYIEEYVNILLLLFLSICNN